MAGITKKAVNLYFHCGPFKKQKRKQNLIEWVFELILNCELILRKPCSGAIAKVFVVITIIKTIVLTVVNSDNSNSNNNYY